jgi:hypothetical protein
MALLTIALFIDALINIARIIETERGMHFQARLFAQDKKEREELIADAFGDKE